MNIGAAIEFFNSFLQSATESANDGAAYGGNMAGAPFDPISFIKKPQVILRMISAFFSIIVFGCIISVNEEDKGNCPLNGDPGACGFGTFVGVVAFIICIVFLVIDARFDNFSNILTRKRAVTIDMGLSGAYAAIWFICFCYLADAWRKTDDMTKAIASVSCINASIAFSFFSIITWAIICFLNYLRYKAGIATIFNNEYEENSQFAQNDVAPPINNQMNNDTFRQPPYNPPPPVNRPLGGYQQPTY